MRLECLHSNLGAPVRAVVPGQDLTWVGLGEAGLVVLSGTKVLARLDVPTRRLALGSDGRSVLAISAEGGVYAVSTEARCLGRIDLDGAAETYDQAGWVTFHGDTLSLRNPYTLEEMARAETFWPDDVERVGKEWWVHICIFGVCQFERYDLSLNRQSVSSAPLHPSITFPPDMILFHTESPCVTQPVLAVHANYGRLDEQTGYALLTRDEPGDHRVVLVSGHTLAYLPSPPKGLAARGDWAVVWAVVPDGMEVDVLSLATENCRGRVL